MANRMQLAENVLQVTSDVYQNGVLQLVYSHAAKLSRQSCTDDMPLRLNSTASYVGVKYCCTGRVPSAHVPIPAT